MWWRRLVDPLLAKLYKAREANTLWDLHVAQKRAFAASRDRRDTGVSGVTAPGIATEIEGKDERFGVDSYNTTTHNYPAPIFVNPAVPPQPPHHGCLIAFCSLLAVTFLSLCLLGGGWLILSRPAITPPDEPVTPPATAPGEQWNVGFFDP